MTGEMVLPRITEDELAATVNLTRLRQLEGQIEKMRGSGSRKPFDANSGITKIGAKRL
jgi:hypothetical protein